MLVFLGWVDVGNGHFSESSARRKRPESGEKLDDSCSFGGHRRVFPSRGIFVQLGSDSERRVKTPGRRRERSGKSVRNSFPRTVVYVVEFGVPEVFADARTGKSGGDYQFYDAHVEHWIESVVHTHVGFWFERRANRDDDFEAGKSDLVRRIQRVE